jgi:hypothetical protein
MFGSAWMICKWCELEVERTVQTGIKTLIASLPLGFEAIGHPLNYQRLRERDPLTEIVPLSAVLGHKFDPSSRSGPMALREWIPCGCGWWRGQKSKMCRIAVNQEELPDAPMDTNDVNHLTEKALLLSKPNWRSATPIQLAIISEHSHMRRNRNRWPTGQEPIDNIQIKSIHKCSVRPGLSSCSHTQPRPKAIDCRLPRAGTIDLITWLTHIDGPMARADAALTEA